MDEFNVEVNFDQVVSEIVMVKGEKGDTGNTGATGPSNTLAIGTVAKGDNAEATITGTSPNQTLNLVLPKGDKGDQGVKGDTGTGIPTGGTTGQVVAKTADGTGWEDVYTKTETDSAISSAISTESANRNTAISTAVNAESSRATGVEALKANKSDLATVATSGNYSDLNNKPIILKSITHDFGEVACTAYANSGNLIGTVSAIIPSGATLVALCPRTIWPKATWQYNDAYLSLNYGSNEIQLYLITDTTQSYKVIVDFLYTE